VSRTQADERHLFVFIAMRDLPFNVADALVFGDTIPPGLPPLMSGSRTFGLFLIPAIAFYSTCCLGRLNRGASLRQRPLMARRR
jgi:hypothetical protein